mmetsp:Transcript_105992/g.187745  ORF Transcript_105992/g.187745 Transcript_105992/m.187745 type:complete len:385 (+) Transcript_105992:80-1234(+)
MLFVLALFSRHAITRSAGVMASSIFKKPACSAVAAMEERSQAALLQRMRATLPPDAPELYAREWTEAAPSSGAAAAGVPLRVVQFNILADGLSGKDENKGGFTESPPASLDWDYRSARLVEEVLRHGELPDIIGMSEVDHFHDWFEPVLAELGYAGAFISKPNSPCRNSLDPKLSDGCALFWQKHKVAMLDLETMNYDSLNEHGRSTGTKANQVALLATLQTSGSVPFVVAVTHLVAPKNRKGERTRAQQVLQLVDRLHAKGLPCLITTDLNASPIQGSKDYAPEAYPVATTHTLRLHSAYADILGSEPEYTTWKRRGDHEDHHTIDYIFLSESLSVSRVLLPPDGKEVDPARFPGWRYPSDHVALFADVLVPSESAEQSPRDG